MSNYQNQNNNSEDYRRYKLTKELQDKAKTEFINDFTDVADLDVYCDLCDRKLVEWDIDKLICPICHITVDPKFTLVKHKPSREGPIDDEDILDGNDLTNISEHYSFSRQKEEKDPFIDSLKARGYQIISSTKK